AFRRKQRCENVAILTSLARGKRGQRPGGKAEVEGDAVEVVSSDPRAGQNEQTMLLHELAELVHDRQDRIRAPIHDRAAADLHDLYPGEETDRTPTRDRACELDVEQGLAGERRGDVLGRGAFGHGVGLTSR